MEQLKAWLTKHQATHAWTAPVRGIGEVQAYFVFESMLLVLVYANGHGWEVFVPPSPSRRIDDTLDAVERTLRASAST